MKISKERAVYLSLNYSGYALNFMSGLILARELGPFVRGEYSYLATFFYITLMIAPLNLKNAVSLAISEKSNLEVEFPIKPMRLLIVAFFVTLAMNAFFLSFLRNEFENAILLSFLISNTLCFLSSYIYIYEGLYRSNSQIGRLGLLRLLGLGLPSVYVFLLYAFSRLDLQSLLLSQAIATLGCCAYVIWGRSKLPKLERKRVSHLAIKTYPGFVLEYLIAILVLISVNLTEKSTTLGHFAIAFSFSLIVDTLYPYFESKIYTLLDSNAKVGSVSIVVKKLKSLFLSQLVLIPGSLLIPIVYGQEYSESVLMAVVLIVGKFAYSAVKFMNIYSTIIEKDYSSPATCNFMYVAMYTFLLMYFKNLGFDQPWRISLLITSTMFMFYVLIFFLKKNKTIEKDFSH